MKTASYTELRNNLKNYIDSVIENSDTVIVNRGAGQAAVLISLAEYNAIKETQYITSSRAMVVRIADAEKSIKEGRGVKLAIEDLWK